jgi:hypothetical protein
LLPISPTGHGTLAKLLLCKFPQCLGDGIRVRFEVTYHTQLIAKRPVLSQLEFPLDSIDLHGKAYNRLQEISFEVGGQHAWPRGRHSRFVKSHQSVNQVCKPYFILDDERNTIDVHCSVVPSGDGRRGGIPTRRNVGMGAMENRESLLLTVKGSLVRISTGDMPEEYSLR